MNLSESKILVTGATGLVGGHVMDVLSSIEISRGQILALGSKEADLRDFSQCQRVVVGCDLVIHLAAVTGGVEVHRKNPASILYDNTLMNLNILRAAAEAGVKKFVGIGSAAAYPAGAPMPLAEEWLFKSLDTTSIHAPYNLSKLSLYMQGIALRKERGLKAIHLIATNMYGPGDDGKTGYVIPTLIQRIKRAKLEGKTEVVIWGSPNDTRDFLYVHDAALAIIAASENYEDETAINIGSGWEVSIGELAQTLCELLQFKGSLVWEKPDDPGSRRVLSTEAATDKLGWKSRTSLKEGLEKTLAWMDALQ